MGAVAGTASRWEGNNLRIEGSVHAQFVDSGVVWANEMHSTTLRVDSSANGGLCAMDGGAAGTCTKTVAAGANCACSNQSATLLPCAPVVSGTTLTMTSTTLHTDTLSYVCL